MKIDVGLVGPADFATWRIALGNLVDHQRRSSPEWCDVGVWGWLSHDGRVRGILNLGLVPEVKFLEIVGRRWPVNLRAIKAEAVRVEVYHSIKPTVIFSAVVWSGRYHAIRATISPQRRAWVDRRSPAQRQAEPQLEPMPVVFGW